MVEMGELTDWDSYLESDIPVILQAGASWCGPCNTLKPMLTETAGQYLGKVKYVYCDVDKFPQVAQMLEITSIPKTYMIWNGDLVDEFSGVPK
jgi:thioredoxin 1